jgi:ribonuclease H
LGHQQLYRPNKRRKKYNLNSLSHDVAIDLIKSVEASGIKIEQVYIDTVGPADKYKDKMRGFFPKYQFTVAEKADSKYPIVSAASVCAKVMRDRIVKNWKYAECDSLHLDAFELGSGYPADPGTKRFLEASLDPVFGYPTLARFSWSTIEKLLDKKACVCDFNVPDEKTTVDPKQVTKQVAFMASFFKGRPSKETSAKKGATSLAAKPEQDRHTNAITFFRDRSLSRVIHWT